MFDDAKLESSDLDLNEPLRWLASTGARIRRAALAKPLGSKENADRPRGILVLGSEARLVRAVLEPACPVPFMAWPGPGLPAWVGPLDLTVVLGEHDTPDWVIECAAEARRRGATLIVVAPERSVLAQVTASSATTLIPTAELDATANAVAVLAELGQLGLGPLVHPEHIADAADLVAQSCAPLRDLAINPGKDLALELADRLPLLWGGSVLAGRAARRIAEAIRRASGQPALAADAVELATLLDAVPQRDLFADPFEEHATSEPVLVLLDHDKLPPRLEETGAWLVEKAQRAGVRVAHISSGPADVAASEVERYVTLLQLGLYGATYLQIGLSHA